jgi:hypothetical protein
VISIFSANSAEDRLLLILGSDIYSLQNPAKLQSIIKESYLVNDN